MKITGYWARSLFAVLWTSTSPVSMKTQKEKLTTDPAILTSRLANNVKMYLRPLRLIHICDRKERSAMGYVF